MKGCQPCRYHYCTGCSKLRHAGQPRIDAGHCKKHCRHKADIKKLPPVTSKGIGYGE